MRHLSFFQRQRITVAIAILALVSIAIAGTVLLARRSFEVTISPAVLGKAETAGNSLASTLGQGAVHGIPIDQLVAVDRLFEDARKKNPEFARIDLRAGGRSLVSSGSDADSPIVSRRAVPGYEADEAVLSVVVDPRYVDRVFREMMLDLAVVAIVALFLSIELLYFLAAAMLGDLGNLRAQLAALGHGTFARLPQPVVLGRSLGEALRRSQAGVVERYEAALATAHAALAASDERLRTAGAQCLASLESLKKRFAFEDKREAHGWRDSFALGAMRTPFFLLLLADDLSRTFLPIFAAGLPTGALDLSPKLVASLPVTVFMVMVALSQPILGGWSEHRGRRRSFLTGAALALTAHAFAATASSVTELLIWRTLGGAAWAIAFVAAQGYVLDHTDERTRAAGLAEFVGVIMVSLICGPSIGGILADGFGHRETLGLSAVLAASGLMMAWRKLPTDSTVPTQALPARPPRTTIAALGNARFVALLLLAAVPAKIVLIAYCYYLIPLYMGELGGTAAMAGRMIMIYAITMVTLVPWMARWVVARRSRAAARPEPGFVVVGLALSGLSGLAMMLPFGFLSILALVFLLGLGQAISISPQAAMVTQVCVNEMKVLGQSAIYGVYRLVERLGNALGPLLGAVLLEIAGFRGAFVGIGLGVLVCSVLFAIVFMVPFPSKSETNADSAQ